MNPPGGLSIIIHVIVVLIGTVRRALTRWLRRTGIAYTPSARAAVRLWRMLGRTAITRPLAYGIIGIASFLLLSTVHISLQSVFVNDTNIDYFLRIIALRDRSAVNAPAEAFHSIAPASLIRSVLAQTSSSISIFPLDTYSITEYPVATGKDLSCENKKALAARVGNASYVGAYRNASVLDLVQDAEETACSDAP
jgi:hypothetical protein